MALTDQDALTQIQYHVIEPDPDGGVTWALGDWDASTVIGYLNQRQDRFLHETAVRVARTTLSTVPNIQRYELPEDLLRIVRVSWQPVSGTIVELPRSDSWELDHGIPTWPYETAARPLLYTEYDVPQRQIQIAPASYDNGILHLLYNEAGTVLSNSGVAFTVPDEYVPFIMWGVLADMLSESARVQDAQRAQYCEQRYQSGVELALLLQNSWTP